MACDLRYGAPRAKTAFLFVRVGLAGCDMGACAILPRIIGQGRAAELLYTGRSMSGRGRPGVGVLQSASATGAVETAARNGERARRRADRGARHDQEDAARGMERRRRPGDRHGSARRRRR